MELSSCNMENSELTFWASKWNKQMTIKKLLNSISFEVINRVKSAFEFTWLRELFLEFKLSKLSYEEITQLGFKSVEEILEANNLKNSFSSHDNYDVTIVNSKGQIFRLTKMLTSVEEPILVGLETQEKYGCVVQNMAFERNNGTIIGISELHEAFYFETAYDDNRSKTLSVTVLAKYLVIKNSFKNGKIKELTYYNRRNGFHSGGVFL